MENFIFCAVLFHKKFQKQGKKSFGKAQFSQKAYFSHLFRSSKIFNSKAGKSLLVILANKKVLQTLLQFLMSQGLSHKKLLEKVFIRYI